MLYSKLLALLFRSWYGKPKVVAEGDASALVLVADGCGGIDLCVIALRHLLGREGDPRLVRMIAWGHGFGRWYADLTDAANHRRGSDRVVAEVLAWRDRHPSVPVYLVGKSGGAWIVVRALEALPAGSVEAAVLLAPAVSPGYDLAPALRAVRREVVSFWSPLDLIVLGLGTGIFGTMDGVRSASAGLRGFREPSPPPDPAATPAPARLRQVRWRPRMALKGYLGGHVGPDSPAFLEAYVLPLFRHDGLAEKVQLPRESSPSGPAPIT